MHCPWFAVIYPAPPAAGQAQSSDLAAAFFDDSEVREIRLYFDDPNWYNTLFRAHSSDPRDPYFPARFQYGSLVIPRIGVRFKGHSSFQRNGINKPFKLDFNEYDDAAAGKFVSQPVPPGAEGEQVYLVAYGTGVRQIPPSSLTAQVGGAAVPIAYAGPQGRVDQLNLGPLPRSLAGKGEVSLVVSDGRFKSNAVTLVIE